MEEQDMTNLYLELFSMENRGVIIRLEGSVSNSITVTCQLAHEHATYMRDYVFDEEKGVLKELHFDRIKEQKVKSGTYKTRKKTIKRNRSASMPDDPDS